MMRCLIYSIPLLTIGCGTIAMPPEPRELTPEAVVVIQECPVTLPSYSPKSATVEDIGEAWIVWAADVAAQVRAADE